MASAITIGQLKEEDIPTVVKWTIEEHWHVSDNIFKANYQIDPDGFFAAYDHSGKIVGVIGSCILSDEIGFGGLFIVHKDHRCKGVGRLLWEKRLQYLQGRNLAINAVAARIEPNKRRGFTYLTFDMEAYGGIPDRLNLTPLSLDGVDIAINPQADLESLKDIIAYDTSVHQFERRNFLKQWVSPDVTTCITAKKNGILIGYGSVQPIMGGSQYHLGPVLAEDGATGELLLNHLAKSIPADKLLVLDIPVTNKTAHNFVTKHGFECHLKLTRMMNRYAFDVPIHKVFAITTLGVSLL